MNGEDAARACADVVVGLPARFMLDGATYARGGSLGFDGIDFYFAGRGGALGDVDAAVVAAAFVFFNPVTVSEAWERTRTVMPRRQAAGEFVACLASWANEHLADDVDWERLALLTGRVVAAASGAAAPLFAAWRKMGEPDGAKALSLHRMNMVRELRGAVHGASVVAAGLEPLEAVLIRTPFMAGAFGWPEPYPDVEHRRGVWETADAAANAAVGRAYGALDATELEQLVELTVAAQQTAR
jgi:hypothetical protein